MSDLLVQDTSLTAVADALRQAGGTDDPLSFPDGFVKAAEDLRTVYDTGYDAGYTEGETTGYTKGQEDGIEQGKQTEYDTFWDNLLQNGERTYFDYAFYSGWTPTTFKPKYKIVPTTMSNGFRNINVPNFASACDLDTSKCTNMTFAFGGLYHEHIGVIDLASAKDWSGLFSGAKNLHTVDKIIIYENTTTPNNPFYNCPALVNLTIEGTIACTLQFNYCVLLSAESAKSIINALKNFVGTGNEYTKTLTLTNSVWARLEEDSTAPDGGTWKDYVNSLGWNT